jgi:hypothetical protein
LIYSSRRQTIFDESRQICIFLVSVTDFRTNQEHSIVGNSGDKCVICVHSGLSGDHLGAPCMRMCSFFDVLAADTHRSTDRRRLYCQRQGVELSTVCWLRLLSRTLHDRGPRSHLLDRYASLVIRRRYHRCRMV